MKLRVVLAVAAVGSTMLTACRGSGQGGDATGTAARKYADGKTFTMAIASDPGSLDPALTALAIALQVDRFLYDSLINIDAKGQEVPGLASKWTGNATTVTYTLRPGITCADGSALTAADVAANINFVGNPANKSPRIGLYVPPGAKATAAGGTVTVTSPTPDAFLGRDVGGLQIVCAKGMADRGILKQGADGTGPYTLTGAVPGDHYTLARRDGYTWGPGDDYDPSQSGAPAKVELKVVSNETTAANLLLSGQVNLATVTGPDRQRLENTRGLVKQETELSLGELWFNQQPGQPTADAAVRKALVQAVDLKQLMKVVTNGSGQPATSLVPPGTSPCNADTVTGNLPGNDTSAAKAVVQAKSPAITLYYPTSQGSGMQAGAELLQQTWSAIGAKVTLKSMTDAQAGQVIVAGQGSWTAALLPVGITLPTQLVPFVSGPTPPNGTNFGFIDNSAYTAGVQAAAHKPGAAGCDDWAAAEKALFQQVDLVPFADSTVPDFAKGATFELSQGSVTPTSIRMLA